MVDGARHHTQRVHIKLGKPPRRHAGDPRCTVCRLAIPKPLCQPGQYPVSREGEDRPKLVGRRVDFTAAVIRQVVACQLTISSKIASGGSRLNTETLNQVVPTNLPNESQAQLQIGQAVTLGLR